MRKMCWPGVIIGLALAFLPIQTKAEVETVKLVSIWDKPAAVLAPPASRSEALQAWLDKVLPAGSQRVAGQLGESAGCVVAEDPGTKSVVLANSHLGLVIGNWSSASPYVASLYHFSTQTEWVTAKSGNLWEIALKRTGHPDILWAEKSVPHVSVSSEKDGVILTLQWTASDIPGAGSGRAGVTVKISLGPDDSCATFSLAVDNALTDAGLWKIRFPILQRVGVDGGCDVVADTLGTSRLIRGCREEINDHLFADQVRTATMGASTLYFATKDLHGIQKYYHFKPGETLDLTVYPANMGVVGKSYRQDFPVEIGAVTGDWFDAATKYREWALQQSWAQRGGIDQWKDPGQAMAKVMLWLQTLSPESRDVPATVRSLKKVAAEAGVKTGVHYYQWWSGDAFFPKILAQPYRAGVIEGFKELREAGLPILPYYNVLYWKLGIKKGDGKVASDPADLKAIEEGACEPLAGTDGDNAAGEKFDAVGNHYIVVQGKNLMMPMCRLTPLWQKEILDLTKKLTATDNDMVYLDQGGVPPRSPCFDPSHGHELGGGNQWSRGTREIMRQVKFDAGRELAICCEGAYEGYLDLVEMQFKHYWPWLSPRASLCPFFEAVYHDRTLFIGAVKSHRDANAYAIDVGTRLLHGNAFRAEVRMFDDPALREQSAFVLRMARLRSLGALFLVEGRLVRPPAWSQDPGEIEADWIFQNDVVTQKIRYPAVERAAFTVPDGREAVFIVNFSSEPQMVSLDLSSWAGSQPFLRLTSSDGKTIQCKPGEAVSISPRDGVMITK